MSEKIQTYQVASRLKQLLKMMDYPEITKIAPFLFPSYNVSDWRIIWTYSDQEVSSSGNKTLVTIPRNIEAILCAYEVQVLSGDGDMDELWVSAPSATQLKKYWNFYSENPYIVDGLTWSPTKISASIDLDVTANQTKYLANNLYIPLAPLSSIGVTYDFNSATDDLEGKFAFLYRKW